MSLGWQLHDRIKFFPAYSKFLWNKVHILFQFILLEIAGTPGAQFVMYNGRWEAMGRIAKTLAANNVDPSTLPPCDGSV